MWYTETEFEGLNIYSLLPASSAPGKNLAISQNFCLKEDREVCDL